MSELITSYLLDSKLRRETANFKFTSSRTQEHREDIEYLGPDYICDPKAADPEKPVLGLYKILPTGLSREDFIGMIIDHGIEYLDPEEELDSICECRMIQAVRTLYSYVHKKYGMCLYPSLTTEEDPLRPTTPYIYFPDNGYFGDRLLEASEIINTGTIDLTADTPVDANAAALTPDEIEIAAEQHNISTYINGLWSEGSTSVSVEDGVATITHEGTDYNFTITVASDKSVQVTSDGDLESATLYVVCDG